MNVIISINLIRINKLKPMMIIVKVDEK